MQKLREFYWFLSEQSGFLFLKIKKGIFYITTALILDQLEHLECTALSNLLFLCTCLYLGSIYEGRGLAERCDYRIGRTVGQKLTIPQPARKRTDIMLQVRDGNEVTHAQKIP